LQHYAEQELSINKNNKATRSRQQQEVGSNNNYAAIFMHQQ